ncbi:MAG: ATP-binding protein [Pirellulaceae bacterium]
MSDGYQFRLRSLTFNDNTVTRPAALTLIVGPNNSGKSQILKDIVEIATKATKSRLETVVVRDLDVELPSSLDVLRTAYPSLNRIRDENGNWQFFGLHPTLVREASVAGGSWPDTFESQFASPDQLLSKGWFFQQFGSGLVTFITTEFRLQLVKESNSSDHNYATTNLLQSLYNAGSPTERAISDEVSAVFEGQQIALDYTTLTRLRLRVSRDFSDVSIDPRDGRHTMLSKPCLDNQGDGIRSFTGMIVALKTADRPLILIDEPEAFLHPPQAYAIGRFIASGAGSGRQIIVATHSTDVLRGALSVTDTVEIIRVDRCDDRNTFAHLTRDTLMSILSDPLLSSARVLDALFYPSAVVTEADADSRLFHSAIERAYPQASSHFVNASNKQTVTKIMSIYSKMGVRRAGIVDFDILRKSDEWLDAINAIGVNQQDSAQLIVLRDAIARYANQQPFGVRLKEVKTLLEEATKLIEECESIAKKEDAEEVLASGPASEKLIGRIERRLQEAAHVTKPWNELKRRGRDMLESNFGIQFDSLWQIAADHGLFIIPTGELESILSDYGVPYTTNKKQWIQQSLRLVPGLEVDNNKRLWKFVGAVFRYLQEKPEG